MESAGQKEELSHSTTEISYENWQSQTQGKKSSTGDSPVRVPNRKVYLTSLEEPRSTLVNPAKEKGHYLELSLFSNALCFKQSFPTYYFSL